MIVPMKLHSEAYISMRMSGFRLFELVVTGIEEATGLEPYGIS